MLSMWNQVRKKEYPEYIFTATSTEKYKSEVVDTIHSFSLSHEDQLIII